MANKGVTLCLDQAIVDNLSLYFGEDKLEYASEFYLKTIPVLITQTIMDIWERFSSSELKLILESMRDVELLPELHGMLIQLEVKHTLATTENHLLFGISPGELLDKINKLTIQQSLALELWTHGYWQNNLHNIQPYAVVNEMKTYMNQ